MILYTEVFGFESDDLSAVTEELSRAIGMPPEPHFYEGFGGDYFAFGDADEPGGGLSLYHNHFHDGLEPDIQEEDFPELGLILLVEQRAEKESDHANS